MLSSVSSYSTRRYCHSAADMCFASLRSRRYDGGARSPARRKKKGTPARRLVQLARDERDDRRRDDGRDERDDHDEHIILKDNIINSNNSKLTVFDCKSILSGELNDKVINN